MCQLEDRQFTLSMSGKSMNDLHVTYWGDKGPPVVLVHGGAQGTQSAGHKNFWAQEPLGEQGWQLIVPDRPGHGGSPSPERGDDPEKDAEALMPLLTEPVHLVAHSFGALVALAMTAVRPSAIRSLTLIEPALQKVAVKHAAVRKTVMGLAWTMLMPFSPATRSRRAMKILGIPQELFKLSEAELEAMGRALTRAKFPSKSLMKKWLAVVRENEIPFQVLSGSASPSFIAVGDTAAQLGGGRNVVVPSENHFPQWQGASFNLLLASFWNEADRPKE